jgi:4-hydroxy-4-methyl-2-oxoglutarate aldolase
MSSRHVVVQNVPRPPAEVIDRLAAAGVATVAEAAGRRGLLDPVVRPVVEGVRIAGSAVTALCHPGDNLMIHAAVEQCEPGDMLVVATTSPSVDGFFGELLATSLHARGVRGVILDTGVRDVADLRTMRFPVWSRAIFAHGTVKETPGAVNVSVVCAGAPVRAGDVIVADDDGVVCVPAAEAAAVAERSEQRLDREEKVRARLAAGELGLDVYHLRPLLADRGVTYVDAQALDQHP